MRIFDIEEDRNFAWRVNLIKRTQNFICDLEIDLNQGLSFRELHDRVETFCGGCPILILPAPKPLPPDLFGFSFRSDEENNYLILYDPLLTGNELMLVILHEFGHIVRGDLKGKNRLSLVGVLEFLKNKNSGIYDHISCRGTSGKDLEEEQEAEFIGRSLFRCLIDSEEQVFNKVWSNLLGDH
ncbi:MAG TPA: hypothetical protein VH186_32165 [Chloroflexia bacterium]|nr:hypothetical protein [Chloroflexia bacterium]